MRKVWSLCSSTGELIDKPFISLMMEMSQKVLTLVNMALSHSSSIGLVTVKLRLFNSPHVLHFCSSSV